MWTEMFFHFVPRYEIQLKWEILKFWKMSAYLQPWNNLVWNIKVGHYQQASSGFTGLTRLLPLHLSQPGRPLLQNEEYNISLNPLFKAEFAGLSNSCQFNLEQIRKAETFLKNGNASKKRCICTAFRFYKSAFFNKDMLCQEIPGQL